jgi:hypothetical protein
MKLAALASVILLAAPALAQTPSSAPRDPLRDEMAAISLTCSSAALEMSRAAVERSSAATPVPPERYEEAAGVCEAALVQLDAVLARIPAPTGQQRSDHARYAFSIHTGTGSIYRQAERSIQRRSRAPGDPMIPGPRACGAYERALEAYGRIDSERRIAASIYLLAGDLAECRDHYGAPIGAAAIPAVARPVPPTPPLGTLRGDFEAMVRPCLSQAMDQDVPLAERTEICERASEAASTVMAIYPDAPDDGRPAVEIQQSMLYTFLAMLQSDTDGGASPRACASLEKAIAVNALVEKRGGFRHPVSGMVDVLLQTRLGSCWG